MRAVRRRSEQWPGLGRKRGPDVEGVGILLLVLLLFAIPGTISAVIAHHKGRSVVGWFFAGSFLALIFLPLGIILVAVLPSLKEDQSYKARVESENRRLREQVRQERIKAETFRQYSMGRLDAHDGALGIDTRSLAGTEPVPAQLDWSVGAAPAPEASSVTWYYEQQGEAKGPVAAHDIRTLLQFKEVTPETLVWAEGMQGWAPLNSVPGLQQEPIAGL